MSVYSIVENKNNKFFLISRYSAEVLQIIDDETLSILKKNLDKNDAIQIEILKDLNISFNINRNRKKGKQPFRFIEFILTYKCNSFCTYCWQKKEGFDTTKAINIEMVERLLLLLKEYNSKFDKTINYEFGFMGGEPLLKSEFIFETFDYTKDYLKNFTANILTNGILLTEDICKELYIRQFNVFVSLDGPQNVNTRRRNFDETWSGIQTALRQNISITIQSTLSYEQITNGLMLETAKFFLKHNLLNFIILVESPIGKINYDLLVSKYEELFLFLGEWSLENKKLPLVIKSTIYQMFNNNDTLGSCFCRFLYPTGLQIDPSGNLIACEFDKEKYLYGNIMDENINLDKYIDELQNKSKYENLKCLTCKYIGICKGYPMLCSLYMNEKNCHQKAFYEAFFNTIVDDLDKYIDIMLKEFKV